MSSTTSPPFTYKPLVGPDAIRLIYLHPAQDISAPVECSLEHTTLSRYSRDLVENYTALSYVWGDPNKTRPITVDGCCLQVTANLDSALRHMRDAERGLWVWADALCIHQADGNEKNLQVQRMGSVYSTASHTIIYLGPSSHEVNSLFEQLEARFAQLAPFGIDEGMAPSDAELQALADGIEAHLLSRPWFTRVWVYQELVQSRDPWVQCGDRRVRWEDLCQLSFMIRDRLLPSETSPAGGVESSELGHSDPRIIHVKGILAPLVNMQSARLRFQISTRGNGQGNHTLLGVLASRRGLGATDARDMIYAHLSVTSDFRSGRGGLQVDYSQTCLQIFTNFAWQIIKRDKNLEILGFVDDLDPIDRRPGLPSWVPDWSSTSFRDSKDIYKKGVFKNKERGLSANLFFSPKSGSPQLMCVGYYIGEIKRVSENVLSFQEIKALDVKKAWSQYLKDEEAYADGVPYSFEELYAGEESRTPGDSRLILSAFKNLYTKFHREWVNIAGLSIAENDIPITVLLRTRSILRNVKKYLKMNIHPVDVMSFQFWYGKYTESTAPPAIARFVEDGICEGRRVCFFDSEISSSHANYIGLVPRATREGDIICMLDKDTRTFVLRKNAEENSFRLVGLCLVSQGYTGVYPGSQPRYKKKYVLC